jgi:hydrogenase maturation protease
VLIIGYGNTLRGDDALGRRVAERIADCAPPGVEAISVTQLVPELSARIAEARAVIFVDAGLEPGANDCTVQELSGIESVPSTTHAAGPRELLGLAATCFHHSPPAWLVAVPARNFAMAEDPTPIAGAKVRAAVRAVQRLLVQLRESEAAHA